MSGSVESLLAGGTFGGALVAIGWLSYQDYVENKEKKQFKSAGYSYTVVSTVLTVAVTLMMGDRYSKSGKMMPAGMVFFMSLAMLGFYAWKLFVSQDVGAHAERARTD